MKFSIIIPVYNVELYLKDCLDSILGQNFNDFEIICINDGSTDLSLDILNSYNDPRIKIINQKNSGQSAARNLGLSTAKGEYIWFIDSDDKIAEDSLWSLNNYILKNDSPNIIFFNSSIFYDNDILQQKGWFQYKRNFYGSTNIIEFFNNEMLKKTLIISPCMYIFKRNLNKDLCFINGIIHEDNPFLIQLIWNNPEHECLSVDNFFYMRRIRPNSIMTMKKEDRHFYGYDASINAILRYKNEKKISNKYLDQFIINLCISNLYIAWQIDEKWISKVKCSVLKKYSKLPLLSFKKKIVLYFPNIISVYLFLKRSK